jgi:hypothetical protein
MPDISHLIDLSDSGSWEAILPFCVNIKVSNYTGGDSPNGLATPASDVSSFHAKENSDVS